MTAQDFAQILAQIKGILSRLNSNENWGDVWYSIATERDRALTRSLCNDDDADFIIERGSFAFLFTVHTEWTVWFLGKPIYWIDPEVYLGLNFGSFISELRHELPGLEIKVGPDSHNKDSMIEDMFGDKIERAITTAINNSDD